MAFIVSGAIHHPDEVIDYLERMEFEYGDIRVLGIVWHEAIREHRVYLETDLSKQETRVMPVLPKKYLTEDMKKALLSKSQQPTEYNLLDQTNKA